MIGSTVEIGISDVTNGYRTSGNVYQKPGVKTTRRHYYKEWQEDELI